MSRSSEKYIERYLGKEVEKRGGKSIKLSAMGLNGIPDRMCLLPGAGIFFAELKSTGKKPDPLQRVWLARLNRLGFEAVVIDKIEQVDKILERYEE